MWFSDVGISVLCGGTRLEEYDVRGESANAATCWIPSKVGQRFEIEYQNRHLFHLGLEIYFDGVLLRRVVSHSGEDGIFQGVAIGNGLIKPFAFSALDTTDDDELFSPDDTRLLHLGTIHIKMFRVETTRVPDCDRLGLSWTGMGPVHERSKKAGAHQIALGDAEFVGALEYFTLRYLDSVDHPYALFTFRYRPEEMLKAQGIIPLPVPLVPTSTGDVRTVKKQEPNTTEAFLLDGPYMENGDVKPVIAHDEPDDLRALKTRMATMSGDVQAIQNQIRKLERKKLRVKKEPPIPTIGGGSSSRTVIDLTLD